MPRGPFGRLWLAAVGSLWVGWLACFPDLSSRLAHTEEQRASVKALLAQNFVIRGLIRDASFVKNKIRVATKQINILFTLCSSFSTRKLSKLSKLSKSSKLSKL